MECQQEFPRLAPPKDIGHNEEKSFPGREILPRLNKDRSLPVRCPFCRQEIDRPKEVEGQWFEFDGGTCACGAAFALDPTARNGGAVLLQAIVMAAGGDWDKALAIAPGEDYDDTPVTHYHPLSHSLSPTAFATLYFVRLRPGAGK